MRIRTALRQLNQPDVGDARTVDLAGRQLAEAVVRGWPEKAPELSAWLDRKFAQSWSRELAAAVPLPLGVVEDVQSRTLWTPQQAVPQAPRAAQLLVARGLQQQAQGDPAVFVEHLATGLAMVRQARHLEPTDAYWSIEAAETVLLQGVELWLEGPGTGPELLRRVLDLLLEHDQASPSDPSDRLRADYLVVLNTVNQPGEWVGGVVDQRRPERRSLASLVTLAWQVPWEQARLQRIVRLWANQGLGPFPLSPLLTSWYVFPRQFNQRPGCPGERALLTARELMVALRLYQMETGQPANSLQALTPKFLSSVPTDETGDVPGYRVSRGEVLLLWMSGENQSRKVPSGQGIITVDSWKFLVPLPLR
jgi:hypothetical protein